MATDDLAAVLRRLGIAKVDLYGDSYGSFFSQAFAVRHPEDVRTLTLDGAYYVGGTDPWYSDTNRALRHAFTVACRRSPAGAHHSGRPMRRIARLVRLIRRHPIVGRAPNADGVVRRVRVGVGSLVSSLTDAATVPAIYRELDAAARAVLRARSYAKPLERLVREDIYVGGAGPVRQYSEGLYVAVECNDYPQVYDVTSPVAARPAQFRAAVSRLHRTSPRLFAPVHHQGVGVVFIRLLRRLPALASPEPMGSSGTDRRLVPRRADPGSRRRPRLPDVARGSEGNSCGIPLIDVRRDGQHDPYQRPGGLRSVRLVIVRRFVRTRDAGDTSCAARYHENRLVDRFARTARETGWSGPPRRTARIAAATVADVLARWWSMLGSHGVGMEGGRFRTHGGLSSAHPVVTWRLHRVEWVRDVGVSGSMRWNRRSGRVRANVRVSGASAVPRTLALRWNDQARHAPATADGELRGRRAGFRFPAP
jgi:hypothetical protein